MASYILGHMVHDLRMHQGLGVLVSNWFLQNELEDRDHTFSATPRLT